MITGSGHRVTTVVMIACSAVKRCLSGDAGTRSASMVATMNVKCRFRTVPVQAWTLSGECSAKSGNVY